MEKILKFILYGLLIVICIIVIAFLLMAILGFLSLGLFV